MIIGKNKFKPDRKNKYNNFRLLPDAEKLYSTFNSTISFVWNLIFHVLCRPTVVKALLFWHVLSLKIVNMCFMNTRSFRINTLGQLSYIFKLRKSTIYILIAMFFIDSLFKLILEEPKLHIRFNTFILKIGAIMTFISRAYFLKEKRFILKLDFCHLNSIA